MARKKAPAKKRDPKDPLGEIIERVNSSRKHSLARGTSLGEIRGFVPTGSTLLDLLLKGGIPQGRLTEIYGTHSIGKSTFVAGLIREVQKAGGFAMVCDTESSMDRATVERVGAKYNDIAWQESYILEDAFSTIREFIHGYEEVTAEMDEKPPCLIVWDTVAASPSKAESEDQAGMADKARQISLELRRTTQMIAESGVALVFVNQVRDKIGGYGHQEDVPGGRAIKFHATLRINIKRASPFQIEGGQRIRFVVEKMKYGSPGREATVHLLHDSGLDEYASLLDWLLDNDPGPVEEGHSGAWMAGGWLKFSLPGGRELSMRAKDLADTLDSDDPGEPLKAFLTDRVRELWT